MYHIFKNSVNQNFNKFIIKGDGGESPCIIVAIWHFNNIFKVYDIVNKIDVGQWALFSLDCANIDYAF